MRKMKRYKKVATDLDGTLSENPLNQEEKPCRILEDIPDCEELIIITSRPPHLREETEKWLKEQNIKYDRLIMPNLPVEYVVEQFKKYDKLKDEVIFGHQVFHKACWINKLKPEIYIEDKPKVASALSLLCPDTEIILVKEILK